MTRANAARSPPSDTAQMLAGDSVAVAVLANDNDPDGDPLGIIGIDAPGHGTIQVEPDQTIRYTPQPGFDGIDSFTYTIGDGARRGRHGERDGHGDVPQHAAGRGSRPGGRPRPAPR